MDTKGFDSNLMNRTFNVQNSSFFSDKKGTHFTEQNPLNRSPAKQMYSFSKAGRFTTYKNALNPNIAYEDNPSTFKSKRNNDSKMFGTQTRFQYYPSHERSKNSPSPAHYSQKPLFSPLNQKQAYSFGVSRDRMKKLYIQAIEKKADDKLPGPGQYQPPSTFGNTGLKYSLRPNTQSDLVALNKSAKYPGPGSYQIPTLIGADNSIRMTSVQQSPQATSFPKARDRFAVPTVQEKSPGPGFYSPRNNFNQHLESLDKSQGITKIGREPRNELDRVYRLRNNIPGPGTYQNIGEFGRYNPPSYIA